MSCSVTAATALVLFLAGVQAYTPYWSRYMHFPPPKKGGPPPQPPTPKPPRGEDAYPGRFLGAGTVNFLSGGRDIELICTLNSANTKIVSNVVWTQVQGLPPPQPPQPYPPKGGPPRSAPLYHCPQCNFPDPDFNSARIIPYTYDGKSVLLIRDVRPNELGVYRCSATSQLDPPGDIETVYQVLKAIPPMPPGPPGKKPGPPPPKGR